MNTGSPVGLNSLGRIQRCGLIEGGVFGEGFEVSKDSGHPRCAICLCALCLLFVGSCVRPQLPTTRLHCTIINTSPLGLQTQLNSILYKLPKLPWSWCLLRATKNELRHLASKIRKTKRARSVSILRFTQLSGFSFICQYMTHRGSAGYDLDMELSDYYVFIYLTAAGILLYKATWANKSGLAFTISQ